jgi:hypothetical protein
LQSDGKVKEEASVNQLNSQDGFDRLHNGNQFVNFLLVATILRQLVNTLADQISSAPPGVSSTKDFSKGQVSERNEVTQYLPESSSRGGKVEEGSTDDKGCKREPCESPVRVIFEPWLGSWIKIKGGDQFVATHNFNFRKFKIKRGQVGIVVAIETEEGVVPDTIITKSVTLEFPEKRVVSKLDFDEPVKDIDATRPTPFPISPFLLLLEENSEKMDLRRANSMWDDNNPVETLVRHGRHPYRDFSCNRNPIVEDPKTSLV